MIPKCIQSSRRHGVDGMRSNQLIDVEGVGVEGVLGASTGPQDSLHPGSLSCKTLPPLPSEQILEPGVGRFGVCHRNRSL